MIEIEQIMLTDEGIAIINPAQFQNVGLKLDEKPVLVDTWYIGEQDWITVDYELSAATTYPLATCTGLLTILNADLIKVSSSELTGGRMLIRHDSGVGEFKEIPISTLRSPDDVHHLLSFKNETVEMVSTCLAVFLYLYGIDGTIIRKRIPVGIRTTLQWIQLKSRFRLTVESPVLSITFHDNDDMLKEAISELPIDAMDGWCDIPNMRVASRKSIRRVRELDAELMGLAFSRKNGFPLSGNVELVRPNKEMFDCISNSVAEFLKWTAGRCGWNIHCAKVQTESGVEELD